MRALPALRTIVNELAPRKENWKLFQSSQKRAPLKRRWYARLAVELRVPALARNNLNSSSPQEPHPMRQTCDVATQAAWDMTVASTRGCRERSRD